MSGSDQRMAACVGGLGERERPATRSSSSRKTHTNSLTPSLTRPASREPAPRAARNFPTRSSYDDSPRSFAARIRAMASAHSADSRRPSGAGSCQAAGLSFSSSHIPSATTSSSSSPLGQAGSWSHGFSFALGGGALFTCGSPGAGALGFWRGFLSVMTCMEPPCLQLDRCRWRTSDDKENSCARPASPSRKPKIRQPADLVAFSSCFPSAAVVVIKTDP